MDVFVSVGTGLSPSQETLVAAVEDRLKAMGLNPCTIGRNTFSTDAPLKAVSQLMDRCSGTVVIAVERYRFDEGTERRGSAREARLQSVVLPTSWNQIEAAMAYARGLPLLVLVEKGLHCDGLLEKGNDWFVLEIDPATISSPTFNGLIEDWRRRLVQAGSQRKSIAQNPATMTVSQILGALKPSQLWALLLAAGSVIAGSFALGAKLLG